MARPCAVCGVNEADDGFTVCSPCWDIEHPKTPPPDPRDAEIAALRAEVERLKAQEEKDAEYLRGILRDVDENNKGLAVCSWCALPTLSDEATKRQHLETCEKNPMRAERDQARAERDVDCPGRAPGESHDGVCLCGGTGKLPAKEVLEDVREHVALLEAELKAIKNRDNKEVEIFIATNLKLTAERDAALEKLAHESKLLETECALSMNSVNAMLKAQGERDAAVKKSERYENALKDVAYIIETEIERDGRAMPEGSRLISGGGVRVLEISVKALDAARGGGE